ncbi:MAG TPA: thioredoxin family protein [Methylomirabilota bacterium]|nr:thioredoxin family protein [Methylomirabilota bacterium]
MLTPERFGEGMTLAEYVGQMTANRERFLEHFHRVQIQPADREALAARAGKCSILVLTEDWCVDALDTLPILARLVDGLPNFELRVFLRDRNLDLMDRYLNRGVYRSIPVFVFLDESLNEIGRLVERPEALTAALDRRVLEVRHALRELVERRVRETRVRLREEHRGQWWQAFVDEVKGRLSAAGTAP